MDMEIARSFICLKKILLWALKYISQEEGRQTGKQQKRMLLEFSDLLSFAIPYAFRRYSIDFIKSTSLTYEN